MAPRLSIGYYRITSKLGEGGMGTVYRAEDTRLNRGAAIKMLPDAFAQDADRLTRFAREAQVLASLNHPNIAAIYGVDCNPSTVPARDRHISRGCSCVTCGGFLEKNGDKTLQGKSAKPSMEELEKALAKL